MDNGLFNLDQSLTVYGDLRLVDDSFDIFDLFLKPLFIFINLILIDCNIFVKLGILCLPAI